MLTGALIALPGREAISMGMALEVISNTERAIRILVCILLFQSTAVNGRITKDSRAMFTVVSLDSQVILFAVNVRTIPLRVV